MSTREHLRFAKRHCLHALQPAISYAFVGYSWVVCEFPDDDRFAKCRKLATAFSVMLGAAGQNYKCATKVRGSCAIAPKEDVLG